MKTEPVQPLGFRRLSLVEQVAGSLRTALADGGWGEHLPGEESLAVQIGVSRPTLRAALALLRAEGRLETSKGRRSRVGRRPPSGSAQAETSGVGVLCPFPRDLLTSEKHPVLFRLRALFAAKGIAYEEIYEAKIGGPKPEARLQALVAARPQMTWILLASTPAVQAWFARAGTRALVLGSCHPDIVLPSVDIDYRAVGWHAAGLFVKYGHTRVAVLTPAHPLAGDLACRDGFADYFAQSAPGVSVIELGAGETPKQLCRRLDLAMRSLTRPTGIFSLRQNFTLTAWVRLLQLKLAVPGEIALLSRDSHPLVDGALPGLARYSRPVDLLAGKVVRVAQALLAARSVATEPTYVMPDFIPGETLGQADAQRRK